MVKIYTSSSCASCRKAIKWLEENKVPYKEINFFQTPITREDIVSMLENSYNGFEDIISTRSKAYQEAGVDIFDMKFNELVDFIIKNPSVLKRPIIIEDNKLQVGYNDEEIRTFIPAHIRREWVCQVMDGNCGYQTELKDALKKALKEE